jgi:nucleoside-diphosphate-sugar epimerase
VKVLVTGSSGFIGRHLAGHLHKQGYDVVGLDIRPAPDASWPTVTCDIRAADPLRDALTAVRPELVAHLAARTDLEGATVADYDANTAGVRALIDAVMATDSVRRCIFTSTQLIARPGQPRSADDDYAPTTPYGASKAAGEQIVRRWDGPITWCIVRPTTIWGPGMNAHYQRFFRHLRRGTYFHVGRSPRHKSYGFVGNTAHQYRRLLEVEAALVHRRTFYLADYRPISLRDWAENLARQMGAPRIRTLPESGARALAHAGDVFAGLGWRSFPFTSFRLANILTGYTVDTSELERIVGPLPYDTAAGVQATVAWLWNAHIIPAPSP